MINKNNAAYLFIGDVMRYFFIFIITLFYILISLIYPSYFKDATYDVSNILIKVLIPSIVPMYVLSSILVNNYFFIKLSHKLFKPFNVFESINSPAIFLSSMLVGNPTTTILVLEKYKNNEITLSDTNIILSNSFINPLFVINSFKLVGINISFAYLYIICNFLCNFIFLYFKPYKKFKETTIQNKYSFYDTINQISPLLLNIFIITLLISYLKIPFTISNNLNLFITIPLNFLEVSTGFLNIANYNINFDLKIIILVILLSSTGLSIVIQTIYFIKQKAPDNIRYFIKSMIINRIKLILFNTILFTLFFKFFI